MDAIRQYVISVTSAAILCGVIKGLVRKGPAHGIIKMLCGTFLAFTFLKPITYLSFDTLANPINIQIEEGSSAIEDGQKVSAEAMKEEISKRISEMLSRKAAEFGAEVLVEVTFSDGPMPVPIGLEITGAVTPYVKVQLRQYIRNELGISEEDLSWSGQK